jgi:hypothetical protein
MTEWKSLIGKTIHGMRRHGNVIAFYDKKDKVIFMAKDTLFAADGNFIETDSIPTMEK